jgi:hypothetical protein
VVPTQIMNKPTPLDILKFTLAHLEEIQKEGVDVNDILERIWPEDATEVLASVAKKVAPMDTIIQKLPQPKEETKVIVANFKKKFQKGN